MPKQANILQWVGIGAAVGAVFYVLSPMPDSNLFANAATGLIGGGLLGGFAAGIRNLFGGK
jgi:hypothetical protein